MAKKPTNPMDPAFFVGRIFAMEGLLLTVLEAVVDKPGTTIEKKTEMLAVFGQNAAALARQALEPWKDHLKYHDAVNAALETVEQHISLLEKNIEAMAGEAGIAAGSPPAGKQEKRR
jgi:hypothetical protein